MNRKIITTADGSTTIRLQEWDEQYHSKHGAIQEAFHVFIKAGLSLFDSKAVSVLEIGFGTGLNAFITLLEAEKRSLSIRYEAVEAYPVSVDEAEKMNYPEQLGIPSSGFMQLHTSNWEQDEKITPNFILKKRKQFFQEITDTEAFDLVYFDAFGARVQPELWSVSVFQKMYNALKPNGFLVTYSSKGSVRRAMLEAGFLVEKLPGPPGKREMLRAVKSVS